MEGAFLVNSGNDRIKAISVVQNLAAPGRGHDPPRPPTSVQGQLGTAARRRRRVDYRSNASGPDPPRHAPLVVYRSCSGSWRWSAQKQGAKAIWKVDRSGSGLGGRAAARVCAPLPKVSRCHSPVRRGSFTSSVLARRAVVFLGTQSACVPDGMAKVPPAFQVP